MDQQRFLQQLQVVLNRKFLPFFMILRGPSVCSY